MERDRKTLRDFARAFPRTSYLGSFRPRFYAPSLFRACCLMMLRGLPTRDQLKLGKDWAQAGVHARVVKERRTRIL